MIVPMERQGPDQEPREAVDERRSYPMDDTTIDYPYPLGYREA